MARAYNIWYIPGRRWTNASLPKEYYFKQQTSTDPLRLSLQEAKAWYKETFIYRNNEKEFVVVEMDANNQPILPKCIKEKQSR